MRSARCSNAEFMDSMDMLTSKDTALGHIGHVLAQEEDYGQQRDHRRIYKLTCFGDPGVLLGYVEE
jgi:hypothetical protein